jgi:hypothetical protein
MPAVLKHVELVPQAEIDGTTSKLLGRQRRGNLDFAQFDVPLDVNVGKNHSEGHPSRKMR